MWNYILAALILFDVIGASYLAYAKRQDRIKKEESNQFVKRRGESEAQYLKRLDDINERLKRENGEIEREVALMKAGSD